MVAIYTSMALYLADPIIVPVFNVRGEKVEETVLPTIYRFPVRPDLIKRVYFSEFTARLQPKGRDPMAGKRTTARSLGVGHGLARVPRIRGTTRAAFAPMTVGGRLAHPPRVEKRIHEEVNKKEKILGTISAIAATSRVDLVRARGHRFEAERLPVVVDSSVLNSISKTKEAIELLKKLGVYQDIIRAREGTRVRAGKGKMRGRRLKVPVSILFILEDHESPFARAVKGLPGVDIARPELVNVLQLAPGAVPGRLTVITTGALQALERRFQVIVP